MLLRSAVILALLILGPRALAQGSLRDPFEGPEPALRAAGGDVRHEVELHQREGDNAHSGRWCEHVRVTGHNGTAIYYAYPLRPARVIGELSASVWLRADRPGLQIVARVVLPRSKHPETGEPLTTLIRGSDYGQVGSWQWLSVHDLPRALAWQVRVLRAQFGPQVDAREAFVDRVLLNVYGGPGTTNVWVDDFELAGGVAPVSGAAGEQAGPVQEALAAYTTAAPAVPAVARAPRVELKNRLTVGGEPFFPRVIEHQGEPLGWLKALGFNCARLAQVPTEALLAEAAREGMWLVAVPPAPADLQERTAAAGHPHVLAAFDWVLAWDLGGGLTRAELDAARCWAEQVRAADPAGRPIVVAAESELGEFTRPPFKVLLADREGLGTSLELSEYADWLRGREQLARAAAPVWAALPTQPAAALVDQMRLVAGAPLPVPSWQLGQLRALVHAALSARARGLYFRSRSRLDAGDPAAQMRAAMLELVNLELALIERWPAAGAFAPGPTTSDGHTRGAVIETDRSRLLLPIYAPPGAQFAVGTQPADQVSFTVPGVPEDDMAYELSPVALRRLTSERVAGGTRVVLDTFSRDSLVIYTQDPRILKSVKAGVEQRGRRAAQLARYLAAARLAQHDALAARLAPPKSTPGGILDARGTAERSLAEAEALARGDFARSYDLAQHALQIVRQIERVHWEQATALGPPLADPLAATFVTLAEHERVAGDVRVAPRSGNRLSEGQCEDLGAMQRAGWRHDLHRLNGIETGVTLSPLAAHSGAAGLLLRASGAKDAAHVTVVETPPVWVTSAPVAVESGDVLQIQAWVKIDAPITGSVDGLMIVDTAGGRALALSLDVTSGWQQVTLLRGAPRSGPFAVTFALGGLGTAAIDDVTIEIVRRGTLPRQAQR